MLFQDLEEIEEFILPASCGLRDHLDMEIIWRFFYTYLIAIPKKEDLKLLMLRFRGMIEMVCTFEVFDN